MKIKMYIPADWALRCRAARHETAKDKRARRNSKVAKRELRKSLNERD